MLRPESVYALFHRVWYNKWSIRCSKNPSATKHTDSASPTQIAIYGIFFLKYYDYSNLLVLCRSNIEIQGDQSNRYC